MRRSDLDAALARAGLPALPAEFSVAPVPQVIPRRVMTTIDAFVRAFDRVTARPAWQRAATADAPSIARAPRSEVCFFSAWDFHLPSGAPDAWQLIEFNDNGSGLLLAALVDDAFFRAAPPVAIRGIEPPVPFPDLAARVLDLVDGEAERFFGGLPEGAIAIVDDADSLRAGRFRAELELLASLLRERGRTAMLTAPGALEWRDGSLRLAGMPVAFVVNRSTDFYFEGSELAALRAAYEAGGVYVAPNPFSYATRSDKRRLEPLSRPERDAETGVLPDERALLAAHVPETRALREEDVDALARHKEALVFKPATGVAGRGLLPASQVGRARLRRLLARRAAYVAQRRVPKASVALDDAAETRLWTDLRVWAYRGERLLVSGRGSRREDRLDLSPPGGWLATWVEGVEAR